MDQESPTVDVIVYGGTASGVVAAVAAARMGAKVMVLEPGRHIGGMLSGGLSFTDFQGQQQVIGGLAREVFERIGRHYGQPVAYHFEPHVAEAVLNDMLEDAGVTVRFASELEGVTMEGSRITRLRTTDGTVLRSAVYIDAGYEGDLMTAVGVSYTVGREGRTAYGESLAGRMELLPGHHQFTDPVSPWREGELLPLVVAQDALAPTGEGDGKFQSYCFRLCLTDRPENQLPITEPGDYDPAEYELLRRTLTAQGDQGAIPLGVGPLPNGKCDLNSNGPVSTNLLGASWEYPEASSARRREIWQEHLRWIHGMMWFLQNDPGVPTRHRDAARKWGLCRDEFRDTNGWPHQLYIREGRRMLGGFVLTQKDLLDEKRKHDTIGMGGYNIDIREVQWVSIRTFNFTQQDQFRMDPRAADRVFMEGYLSQPVEPWDIPYRSLIPQPSECSNLLVPVCASMSTIACASFRMEPGYMIAGHAAGVAAALSLSQDSTVQEIDTAKLQHALREQGQILETKP